ncbi:MAG: hypothetical protein ACRC2U_08405 [Aeromonas sp.]
MIAQGLIALALLSLGMVLAWFTAGALILKQTGIILTEHRLILRVLLIARWPVLARKINERVAERQQGGQG